jgi:uncharacterized protein (UPF0276 family)
VSAEPRSIPSQPIPARAGIGLRHPHVQEFLESRPAIAWLEVHSENYLVPGGPRLAAIEKIRRDYPISCHGVGLSLGSAAGLDPLHLAALRSLFDRIAPAIVSEHVSWSVADGIYYNDLLPLPLTEEALDTVCRNVEHSQEMFGRQILIENPSGYLDLAASRIPEPEFIAEIVRRTGCGLLLDVNNVFVSAHNRGLDASSYLAALAKPWVGEIHVAGHALRRFGDQDLLIDDHGSRTRPEVWDLLRVALACCGPVPVLVEWDTDIPELPVLLDEARKAQQMIDTTATRPITARAA